MKDGQSDFTLLLNNDTTVDPNFLQPLVDCFEDPNCGMVTPVIFFMEPADQKVIWALGGKCNFWTGQCGSLWKGKDYEKTKESISDLQMDYISGCCFLIRNSTLKTIGFFREGFFAYYEDTDLSYRLKCLGLKFRIAEGSFVRHVAGGSSEKSSKGKSALGWYLYVRNQLWFFKRHAKFYHYLTYSPIKTLEILYLTIRNITSIQKLKAMYIGIYHGGFFNELNFKGKLFK